MTLEEATSYANWLSATTGKIYRLISETEWERIMRAGQPRRIGGARQWKRGRRILVKPSPASRAEPPTEETMLSELKDQAHRIETEHDLLREVHLAVEEIQSGMEEVASAMSEQARGNNR